jgi:hypothetical protein
MSGWYAKELLSVEILLKNGAMLRKLVSRSEEPRRRTLSAL